MSFLDSWTNAAEAPSRIQTQDNANALTGLDFRQRQGAQNALQHLDLSDPGSVNNALTGLLKSGMIDQAKSLTDLAMTRGVSSASLPVIQDALGMARRKLQGADQSAAPQEQQQPQDAQGLHDRLMGEAADATGALLAIKDPTERATAANAVRQKFIQEGIPQANVDEVLSDLSDQGLAAHQKFFQDAAAGTPSLHPTGFAASRQQYPDAFSAHNPGGQQAEATLNGPFADPLVQGIMSKYVADVSPGVNQAIAITGPERSAAAGAPYTPVTVEGPQGQNVSMSAANFAAGQAQPGAQAIQGITPGQHAAQTAQANAPYTPVTVTGPQGQPETVSAAQFAEGRGAPPPQPGAPAGPASAPPIIGPTVAGRAGLQGGAEASVGAATNFENYTNGYRTRKTNLENLRMAARDISTGPHAPFWGMLGQLAAEYHIKTPLAPTADQTAAYEETQKMAQSVLAQQRDTLGLPNTNQSVTLATGATPHENTSPQGLQRLAGVLEGNEDYIFATRQAWNTWKAHGHGYETFQDFVPQFLKLFDPRIFQAQYLTAPERARVRETVGAQRFDAEQAAAKRLGYIG